MGNNPPGGGAWTGDAPNQQAQLYQQVMGQGQQQPIPFGGGGQPSPLPMVGDQGGIRYGDESQPAPTPMVGGGNGMPSQPQTPFRNGGGWGGGQNKGWGNFGGFMSPFGGMQNPYNQYSNQANFLNPSLAAPGMNSMYQQNPNAFMSAYSPAAFSQFPYFYGQNPQSWNNMSGLIQPFGGQGPQTGGGGGGGGGAGQVVTQQAPQQRMQPLPNWGGGQAQAQPNPYSFLNFGVGGGNPYAGGGSTANSFGYLGQPGNTANSFGYLGGLRW